MAENKWIVDGHHYKCPDCEKTLAIVVNESDEGFDFCPFCGKRLAGGLTINDNRMKQVASLFGKKLEDEFKICMPIKLRRTVKFTERGLLYFDDIEQEWRKNYAHLDFLCRGKVVIVDE